MIGRLWVDGKEPVECRSAVFTVTALVDLFDGEKRVDRPDAPEVRYDLSIVVDDSSGEDSAASPNAVLPVLDATGGRHPSLWELGSLHLTDRDDGTWDNAWFGNDAPGLAENDVQFLGWTETSLRLRWTAVNFNRGRAFNGYDLDGEELHPPTPGTFRFEGEASFEAVACYVQSVADADQAMVAVWGAGFLDSITREVQPTFPIEGTDPVQFKSSLVTYRLTRPPVGP